jgi:hypothetical protein
MLPVAHAVQRELAACACHAIGGGAHCSEAVGRNVTEEDQRQMDVLGASRVPAARAPDRLRAAPEFALKPGLRPQREEQAQRS